MISASDRFYVLLLTITCFSTLATSCPVKAQLTPDNSLGDENSTVTPNITVQDEIADLIEGGAVRDSNLFHSFRDFNVGDGDAVYFASPQGISNILTRVTSNNISNIFGTLGVNGSANLFLLNPNGIVFGKDAALDINGSFLATTAESYIFENDFEYSGAQPNFPPLLTINLPVGLQFGSNTGKIINRSRFTNKNNIIQGLNIGSNQSLSLIGGEVALKGGYLTTSAGNIEIGSVASQNTVGLVPSFRGWTIDYNGVENFEDIAINDFGEIYAGEIGNSNITLTGKNISLGHSLKNVSETNTKLNDFFTLDSLPQIDELPRDQVHIVANNTDNLVPSQVSIIAKETFSIIGGSNLAVQTVGTEDAGAINVNADTVVIYNGGFEGSAQTNSSGNGAIVTFNANRMSVQNGGGGVNTSGSGNGGTINLNIANDLKIKAGGFGADTFDTGDGGRIEVNAGNLEIIEGGAGVNTLGSGDGGTIDLNIANELKIRFGGFGSDSVSTGNGGKIEIDAKTINLNNAGMGVNARNIGQGGQIEINAETIFLGNGAIGSQSGIQEDARDFDRNQLQQKFGQQDAGDGGIISIKADSLFLNEGGEINTKTFGIGNAGLINLEVGYLQLEGNSNNQATINSSTQASGNGGNIRIVSNDIKISQEASIIANSQETGNAGDINITAGNIIRLEDEGKISVDGGREGKSGNINLNANQVYLLEDSIITATVELGNEGNIFVAANSLFLDGQSKITTDAKNDSSGGNIFIDLNQNFVALSDSLIVSNAVEGQGGNIQIRTTGFFVSSDSLIEASSEFGVDGTVQVNTFDANYDSTLISLPDKLVDPSFYLTRGCGLKNNHSLVNLGRGGLIESPLNTIANSILIPDIKVSENIPVIELQNNREYSHFDDKFIDNDIVEAQAWKVNQQGNIELLGDAQKYNIANQVSCAVDKQESK